MMKVQCDLCAEAASVFCCADEAPLCDACDRHVHLANKLVRKHLRLSLPHAEPSSLPSTQMTRPLCDNCQERRGILFCKEERKILCRECDLPLHTASALMRRHSRLLLTGVRFSSMPVDPPTVPDEEEEEEVVVVVEENNRSPHNADPCSGGGGGVPGVTTASVSGGVPGAPTASVSGGSSIFEYFTKTLPGWRVEDFLVDDAGAGIAACSDGQDQGGQVAIGGLLEETCAARAAGEQVLSDVAVAADERTSRERWVQQIQKHADWTGSKRPRASLPCSYS